MIKHLYRMTFETWNKLSWLAFSCSWQKNGSVMMYLKYRAEWLRFREIMKICMFLRQCLKQFFAWSAFFCEDCSFSFFGTTKANFIRIGNLLRFKLSELTQKIINWISGKKRKLKLRCYARVRLALYCKLWTTPRFLKCFGRFCAFQDWG